MIQNLVYFQVYFSHENVMFQLATLGMLRSHSGGKIGRTFRNVKSMCRGLSLWQGQVYSYNIHYGEQVCVWGREAGEKLEKRSGTI